jgi:hypothetical protein
MYQQLKLAQAASTGTKVSKSSTTTTTTPPKKKS